MKDRKYRWLIFFMSAVLSTACYDKDLVDLEEEIYYHPEYSIPLGKDEMDMAFMVEEYFGDLIEIVDTLSLPDSLHVFFYNYLYYFGPTIFEFESFESIDLSTIEDLDYITSAMIRTNSINRIPANIFAQVYFLDFSLQVIDSLYKDNWLEIKAAEVDSVGKVIESSELWKKDVELSEEFILRIPDIAYVRTETYVVLENFVNTSIQYIDEQDIWIQLALRIKLDLPLHEL